MHAVSAGSTSQVPPKTAVRDQRECWKRVVSSCASQRIKRRETFRNDSHEFKHQRAPSVFLSNHEYDFTGCSVMNATSAMKLGSSGVNRQKGRARSGRHVHFSRSLCNQLLNTLHKSGSLSLCSKLMFQMQYRERYLVYLYVS